MCVPIYPNEEHPTGRTPAYTKPIFPFSNCYHWAFYNIDVRIRATQEGWNAGEAVRLLSKSKVSMDMHWDADFEEAMCARRRLKNLNEGERCNVFFMVMCRISLFDNYYIRFWRRRSRESRCLIRDVVAKDS